MNGGETIDFMNEWMWAIFIGVGLLFVVLELLVGLDTGLDMVFIGTAFILGGLVSLPFKLWVLTVILTAVICVAYVFFGRTYIHRRTAVKLERTNIDAVIGSNGVVIQPIGHNVIGRVKVHNERWRAKAEEDIPEGSEVIVTGVTGTTLSVKKSEGGAL